MIKCVIYGSNDRCIYKILRKLHTNFHFDYTIVKPIKTNILLSENPHQDLLLFIVLGILNEVRQNVKQLWFVFCW